MVKLTPGVNIADIFVPKSTNLKPKYKKASCKTCMQKSREYNVGEIDT